VLFSLKYFLKHRLQQMLLGANLAQFSCKTVICASASGGLRHSDPYRGFIPGPRWGDFLPQTLYTGPPAKKTRLRSARL